MNEVQVFKFKGRNVRTVMKDNDPWWIAKDVCEVLGLSDVSMSVRSLEKDEKDTSNICTLGGSQFLTIISEAGLYSLILRSRKPEAKEFKRWVTHEVLPTIRKHGVYMTPEVIEKTILHPDFIIRLATELKNEQEKSKKLQAQAALDAPKVLFSDAVSSSPTTILVGELAKLLKQNGIDIGQNRLFERLRADGYLMKRGSSHNLPTQKAMDDGLFEIKETTFTSPSGKAVVYKTPKVTGKGQVFFINKFLNNTNLKLEG